MLSVWFTADAQESLLNLPKRHFYFLDIQQAQDATNSSVKPLLQNEQCTLSSTGQ